MGATERLIKMIMNDDFNRECADAFMQMVSLYGYARNLSIELYALMKAIVDDDDDMIDSLYRINCIRKNGGEAVEKVNGNTPFIVCGIIEAYRKDHKQKGGK